MSAAQVVPILVWPVSALVLSVAVLWLGWRGRWTVLGWFGLDALARRAPWFGGLAALGLLLAPFWLVALYYAVSSFFVLTASPLAPLGPAGRALHFGALAALGAVSGLLVAGPFALARAWRAERALAEQASRARAREEAEAEARFAEAVRELAARSTVTRRRFQPCYQRLPGGNIRRDARGRPVIETDGEGRAIGEWQVWRESVPNVEQRIGALFALEQIALGHERLHLPVIETLAAYVRENARRSDEPDPAAPAEPAPPRADIIQALRIIARRPEARRALERSRTPPFRPDLSAAELPLADLAGLDLSEVVLARADLSGAWLDGARLARADLTAASLAECWAEEADFSHARLEAADLAGAWLARARLVRALLGGADLSGARLRKADLTGAELDRAVTGGTDVAGARMTLAWLHGLDCRGLVNLRQDQIDEAFGDGTTRLPEHIARPRHWPAERLSHAESWQLWREACAEAGLPD